MKNCNRNLTQGRLGWRDTYKCVAPGAAGIPTLPCCGGRKGHGWLAFCLQMPVERGRVCRLAVRNEPYRPAKRPIPGGKTACFAAQSGSSCNSLTLNMLANGSHFTKLFYNKRLQPQAMPMAQ